eukprot:33250-Chlamydomonas_euryale.AAC.11
MPDVVTSVTITWNVITGVDGVCSCKPHVYPEASASGRTSANANALSRRKILESVKWIGSFEIREVVPLSKVKDVSRRSTLPFVGGM